MTEKKTKTYEKPAIKKQVGMEFPLRGIEGVSKELACRQCSSCHGCR
ncbi:MAG: hypothetical protein KKA32_06485 [Actinobacteria bacterium]|nr:hypothetical protein [Actinomycetota bacterium]